MSVIIKTSLWNLASSEATIEIHASHGRSMIDWSHYLGRLEEGEHLESSKIPGEATSFIPIWKMLPIFLCFRDIFRFYLSQFKPNLV